MARSSRPEPTTCVRQQLLPRERSFPAENAKTSVFMDVTGGSAAVSSAGSPRLVPTRLQRAHAAWSARSHGWHRALRPTPPGLCQRRLPRATRDGTGSAHSSVARIAQGPGCGRLDPPVLHRKRVRVDVAQLHRLDPARIDQHRRYGLLERFAQPIPRLRPGGHRASRAARCGLSRGR